MTFYVTPLDSSCLAILGHNWLTRYNPLIDWVLGSITLQTAQATKSSYMTSARTVSIQDPPISESTPGLPQKLPPTTPSPLTPPNIAFINAAAFARASKLEGSQTFVLNCQDTKLRASKTEHSVDLNYIPEEYHEFADIFNKAKADTLAPHRPYNLKINLEEGSSPPFGPIYSMAPSELESLREFLDEHLNIGFIRPSCSAYSAPILFIQKKDGSL